ALGLAILHRSVRDAGSPAALVVSIGECVRRGLPTAARASLAARAPLTGLLAEGSVGGDLGRRLASVCDALVLRGATRLPGAVLVIDRDGRARLEQHPDLVGADPARTHAELVARLGPCATLRVGVAGERMIPFASLASGDEHPSFVGRGGLGAVLGRAGLKAVAVTAPEVASSPDVALGAALGSSPRLVARGEGGTLELAAAFAARGDLRGRNYGAPLDPEQGAALVAEARDAARGRRGCRGCPTPCGWVFARAESDETQGAHFGATYALGPNLGLERFEDALELLAACDRLGVDAKEVGAGLALILAARERGVLPGSPAWGDRGRLLAWIEDLVPQRAEGRLLARGSAGIARALGLEELAFTTRGQAARPESALAAVLGQCVTCGGVDPMRSFPLLAEAGLAEARRDDPRSPSGKGRLVWWHENLVSAVDATGFCVFSAAGLLADRVTDLDRLAGWILPAALRDGEGPRGELLLLLGASLALLRRELDRAFGAPPDQDRPAWARELVDQPGMLDEYRRRRGLDAGGYPTLEALERLAEGTLLQLGSADEAAEEPEAEVLPRAVSASEPGRVVLRATGPLARALGSAAEIELDLPVPLREVLERVGDRQAGAAAWLIRDGLLVPVVYRDGARLAAGDPVEDGDTLDLVVAISGG
ncbi:MAG: hypothetical protein O7B99_00665, partial [Planctomycetota bacterium]|nr:hypothetical protein [Planctomycetota bacterium]